MWLNRGQTYINESLWCNKHNKDYKSNRHDNKNSSSNSSISNNSMILHIVLKCINAVIIIGMNY